MENFVFGLQALASDIKITTLALLRHQMMWGFGVGFVASTMVHAFVVTDNPRQIPAMLTRDTRDSFISVMPQAPDGTYQVSYTAFQRDYNRVRIIFYSLLLAFLAVVGIALLRY